MSVFLSLALLAATQEPSAASTTIQWVNMCQNQAAQGSSANFREACACATGMIGGRTTQREYHLLGELIPGMNNPQTMPDLVRTLAEDGRYSLEEISQLGQLLETLQPEIDRVCGPLE